jgi:Mn2+/Fe2+ NRAMP family transporter
MAVAAHPGTVGGVPFRPRASRRGAPGEPAGPDGDRVQPAPRGWARIAWVGPGFLWMVSAAGSGELLFTPRVGALYGYALVWALLAAVILKWFINREVGRFAVCTGGSVLDGFAKLPGPRNWALWLILGPQLVVAVASIAGLAGSAATALALALPGDPRVWMVASVLAATALVLWGRYKAVERAATVLAVGLALAAIAAAAAVFPGFGALATGLVPRVPPETDIGEVLPWLGFMLSGAAGMIWYSYWIPAKGYGAAGLAEKPADPRRLSPEARQELRGWVGQMTLDNTVAVVGTVVVTLAFLVLGTELLRPQGLVPEEEKVAEVLGQLLGGVWGPVGFWFMVVGVFVGFWDTVLSDQDGFGRMYANGTRHLAQQFGLTGRWTDEVFLQRAFVVVLVTALPIGLYLAIGKPVTLLKVAGAVEAAHIPVLAGLTLFLNHRLLPGDLRASWPVIAATGLAALFFLGFAAVYFWTLIQPA